MAKDFHIVKVEEGPMVASTQMGISTDNQGIERAAIMLQKGDCGSIDVFNEAGQHLCMINIFDFAKADGKDAGAGNVDVILYGEKQAGLIAFRKADASLEPPTFEVGEGNGNPAYRIDATLPGAQIFAVNIHAGQGAEVKPTKPSKKGKGK